MCPRPTASDDVIASQRAVAVEQIDGELELLVCFQDEIRVMALPKHGDVTLGRAEDNSVRLNYPAVSRHHAVLRIGPRLLIEDLGGANGTLLRDEHARLEDQTLNLKQLVRQNAEISVGDSIVLGAVTLVVRRRAVDGFAASADARAMPSAHSPALKRVYEQAERAAQSPLTILILGETGVGKEVLARAIHACSPRAKRAFMGINCATLTESLLEGELFGYERGAFTGAVQARPGLFEAADGGSVFLDEIGELPLGMQAKLLRVLEERAVMRLGSRSLRAVDLRFIAASNRDLAAEVAAGRFRQDLYFRLNAVHLTIPPLRERLEEIEPLVRAFVLRSCELLDRRAPVTVQDDVMELLQRYSWPGNVRELRNVVERAVVLCNQSVVTPADLPAHLVSEVESRATPAIGFESEAPPPVSGAGSRAASASGSMRDDIRSLERSRIVSVLDQCDGNQTQAAKLLGISRRTLTSRLEEFALPRPRKRNVSG
jgi:two-component system, NtrC family, response regulator AtoC